jgi:hypothetical protein
METKNISAVALSAKSYTLSTGKSISQLSPYSSYYGIFRDAPRSREQAWEEFGAPSLPVYFMRGVDTFSGIIEEFADLSKPMTYEMEKKLYFMMESLLYVRKLIPEVEDSV